MQGNEAKSNVLKTCNRICCHEQSNEYSLNMDDFLADDISPGGDVICEFYVNFCETEEGIPRF